MLRCWRPELTQTVGDTLIAYRMVGGSDAGAAARSLAALHLERRAALQRAADVIGLEVQSFVESQDATGPKLRVFPLLKPFVKEGEFCFVTSMPAQLSAYIKPRMKSTVMENGRPLGPADSLNHLIGD